MQDHSNSDQQVRSYDDLPMITDNGTIDLQCPDCGPLLTPRRAPTLSDFTNAAIEHLENYHLPNLQRATGLTGREVA
jgi:hypothetical protein